MPFYRVNGLMVHLNLGGKLRKNPPAPCCGRIPYRPGPTTVSVRCCAISQFLCDYKLADGHTCDAPLCPDCAAQVGPDRHFCPVHARQSNLPLPA